MGSSATWPAAVKSLGHRALDWPGVRPAARRAYVLLGRWIGRRLQRVDGVVSTYLGGSTALPAMIRPGISDIDLIVFVRFASEEEEVAALRKIDSFVRRVHRLVPPFQELSCLPAETVRLNQERGSYYYRRFPRHLLHVSGEEIPEAPAHRDEPLVRLVECLKAYVKGNIGARHFVPGTGFTHRARLVRSLQNAVRAAFDLPWDLPPEEVLRQARRLKAFRDAPVERASGVDLVGGHVEAVQLFCEQVASEWNDTWPTHGQAPAVPLTKEVEAVARRWLEGGFESLVAVPLVPGWSDHMLIAVAPEGAGPDWLARRADLLDDRPRHLPESFARRCPRVVPLTRSMWKAGALLPQPPFPGALLGSGAASWFGEPLPPPPAPPPGTLRILVDSRVLFLTSWFWSGCFRPRKGARTIDRFWAESLGCLAPLLAEAQDSGSIPLGTRPQQVPADLRGRVRLVRSWCADRYRALAESG